MPAPPWVPGIYQGYWRWSNEYAKTTDYVLTKKFAGGLFTNAGALGAVIFTLPAIAPNMAFGFRVVADQDVTITSAEGDNIVGIDDAAATSLAFTTGSQKVGGGIVIESNAAGTLWYATNISAGANTISVA